MHCKDFGINEESAKQSRQTNLKKVNEGEKNTNQLINEKLKRAYVKLKHKNKMQSFIITVVIQYWLLKSISIFNWAYKFCAVLHN